MMVTGKFLSLRSHEWTDRYRGFCLQLWACKFDGFQKMQSGESLLHEIKLLEIWKIVLTETLISVINKNLCLLKRFPFIMILIVA